MCGSPPANNDLGRFFNGAHAYARYSSIGSVVFAHLLIKGVNYGIHGFLLRIRNSDHSVVQGVRIEDMGHKMVRVGLLVRSAAT